MTEVPNWNQYFEKSREEAIDGLQQAALALGRMLDIHGLQSGDALKGTISGEGVMYWSMKGTIEGFLDELNTEAPLTGGYTKTGHSSDRGRVNDEERQYRPHFFDGVEI